MIPRAANITVSTQLPKLLREKLIEASFVEWPQLAIGESLARKLAIERAIAWGRSTYPGLFRPQ